MLWLFMKLHERFKRTLIAEFYFFLFILKAEYQRVLVSPGMRVSIAHQRLFVSLFVVCLIVCFLLVWIACLFVFLFECSYQKLIVCQ